MSTLTKSKMSFSFLCHFLLSSCFHFLTFWNQLLNSSFLFYVWTISCRAGSCWFRLYFNVSRWCLVLSFVHWYSFSFKNWYSLFKIHVLEGFILNFNSIRFVLISKLKSKLKRAFCHHKPGMPRNYQFQKHTCTN